MDGIQAVQIIRGMGYSHPIIALTANAVAGQANIFLASGFDDFISKPIDMRLLDISLNTFIYEKQTPETLAAAQMEKEKMNAAVAFAAEALPTGVPAAAKDSRAGMPLDIPVLNTSRGLSLFEEETETYISALRSFTENVPEMIEKLRGVTEENLKEYAINVHSLKSISGWICADDIRARAANLELLANAGDLLGVTTLNPELLKETEDLITNLNTQLL
jgi:CheY-like chemotaxis protein